MAKSKKGQENQKQQLPFRAPSEMMDAKFKVMMLLKQAGVSVSESDVLRTITKRCFAPRRPSRQQRGAAAVYGPMAVDDLMHYLTPKLLARAQPLIKSQDMAVAIEEVSNGLWTLEVWFSHEHLFRCQVEEWELAAHEEAKASKTGKMPNATISVYLTGKEKRAARRRAQRMNLKRARINGESILLRLVASHTLPDLLEFLEARLPSDARSPKRDAKGEKS